MTNLLTQTKLEDSEADVLVCWGYQWHYFRKEEILLLSATTSWEDVEKTEPGSLRGAEQKDVTQQAQVEIWEISI